MEIQKKANNFLYIREWVAICFIAFLFFIFHAVPLFFSPLIMQNTSEKDFWEEVSVTVWGQVKDPGVFIGHKGETLKVFFKRVSLLKEADLSSFKLSKKIEGGETLVVPREEEIVIWMNKENEEEYHYFTLPKNSTSEELKSLFSIEEGQLKKFFKRKRKLQHGEKINFFNK